ncbi:inter-alpha-trypsin inhibitor heavy chain H3-like [Micropterus salmoides]|uniref:inter-alpha-trypsin inhibitor heavy chain H3-like n=1 Tax=Micropterus salmoides TaxID=27706 RepID=UPI0018EB7653|nr:inter-alpha-trypsin inhibitor heavy chain H3-like [Micropterus salmoides]
MRRLTDCIFIFIVSLGKLLVNDDWDIYSFHNNSTVTSRYATTVITRRVANCMDESKEIEFHVRIPKYTFISKFKMLIDGQEYNGVVKAKEQAQQQYTEAVFCGQSAVLVSSVGRTLEEFKASVTVAAHKKVTFELTYEELLKRKLGKYELQIHARPMQPVKDLKADVYMRAGINFIEVKGRLSTKALANAITKTHADKQAWVHFYPTENQQKTCDSCGDQGMNGDLVIVYDINRDTSLGDIKGFYEEVATPLLTDVTMIYAGATNLTQTNFSQYYNGSEIAVAGQITDNDMKTFSPQVVAISLSGPEKQNQNVKKEALELSLKYSFVTPLTSMVVTKHLGENTDVLHKPKEGATPRAWQPLVGSGPWMLRPNAGSMGYKDTETIFPIQENTVYYRSVCCVTLCVSVSLCSSVVPLIHRFLLRTETMSLPLCFDVPGDVRLKLLHHPNRELSVNGELDSVAYGGFKRIVIHFKADLHVEVDTQRITVQEGQMTQHTGQDLITVGSLTVFMRNQEIDVAAGDTRMVILIHKRGDKEFIWPVLRQKPSDNNISGILDSSLRCSTLPQQNLRSKTRRLMLPDLMLSTTVLSFP